MLFLKSNFRHAKGYGIANVQHRAVTDFQHTVSNQHRVFGVDYSQQVRIHTVFSFHHYVYRTTTYGGVSTYRYILYGVCIHTANNVTANSQPIYRSGILWSIHDNQLCNVSYGWFRLLFLLLIKSYRFFLYLYSHCLMTRGACHLHHVTLVWTIEGKRLFAMRTIEFNKIVFHISSSFQSGIIPLNHRGVNNIRRVIYILFHDVVSHIIAVVRSRSHVANTVVCHQFCIINCNIDGEAHHFSS